MWSSDHEQLQALGFSGSWRKKYAFRVSDASLCVILNTEQGDTLVNEYLARDLISKLQNLRKTSDHLTRNEVRLEGSTVTYVTLKRL